MKMTHDNWQSVVVSPETAIEKIRPGMHIFLGTAMAEPRTMVRHLMTSDSKNLEDLELLQLVSFGDAMSLQTAHSPKYRLKTFFSGRMANKAISEGMADLIPSRHARIPRLIESRQIPVDMAIVQISPPNESGFCSLGIAVDVAREAMEQASIRVGEISTQIPRTFGDTSVQLTDFDFLIQSTEPPIYFDRSKRDECWDQVAQHVASLIEDKSCLAFSIGPFYDALARHLTNKRHLGIHSPVFTDSLMDLMKCGAVTNRYKETYRGKSLTSYALGTIELLEWLDNNSLVEFQRIDKVFNPLIIGQNARFVTLVAASKVDLYGRIGLNTGKGILACGPSEVMDFISGAEMSEGGRTIFALRSRNRNGESNILASLADDLPDQYSVFESASTVVTEYGFANLEGCTVRERAQALIEIAHPDDRAGLVEVARNRKIVYFNQIFKGESARLYPSDITAAHTFRNDIRVRFRGIKPSDEEEMRHLFYRFSEDAVYNRYLHAISSMPHIKMQEYVNVDWNQVMSIVGVVGEKKGFIVAEARYIKIPNSAFAEIVFVVDEKYQRLGIASFLYNMLIRLAKEHGIKGFVADVLFSNTAMMRVFKKNGFPIKTHLEAGVFNLDIPFVTE